MHQPTFGHVRPSDLSLFTDRYELTMMEGYHASEHEPEATFSVYFRRLPPDRGYAIAVGLEQVIDYLETVEFTDEALAVATQAMFHRTRSATRSRFG
jgi:nicotinate phosphoribosyltransferase